MKKILKYLIVSILIALGICVAVLPGSHPKTLGQRDLAANEIKKLWHKIMIAKNDREDSVTVSFEAMAGAGVISTNELNYIRTHKIRFNGFPTHNEDAASFPLLEELRPDNVRIIAFADGHLEFRQLPTQVEPKNR